MFDEFFFLELIFGYVDVVEFFIIRIVGRVIVWVYFSDSMFSDVGGGCVVRFVSRRWRVLNERGRGGRWRWWGAWRAIHVQVVIMMWCVWFVRLWYLLMMMMMMLFLLWLVLLLFSRCCLMGWVFLRRMRMSLSLLRLVLMLL